MKTDLTPTQSDVLNYCREHLKRMQCPPTRSEIAAHFGWASANAAQDVLKALAKKGHILLLKHKSRGVFLT